ncbi:hypothetical protein ZWY2020_038309 [Hordeum vulgare]|nr:hypothetical protein ZWY2020_038309 [Hordeum vulgare]
MPAISGSMCRGGPGQQPARDRPPHSTSTSILLFPFPFLFRLPPPAALARLAPTHHPHHHLPHLGIAPPHAPIFPPAPRYGAAGGVTTGTCAVRRAPADSASNAVT